MSATRTWLRRFLAGTAVLLGAAQFFPPARNAGTTAEGPQSLAAVLNPPPEVRNFLAAACYDCHSDRTEYPWYARVQPAGWLMAGHIRDGKRALNLSTFAVLGKQAQARRLDYMRDAVAEGEMPMALFSALHPRARVTAEEKEMFARWTESVQTRQVVAAKE